MTAFGKGQTLGKEDEIDQEDDQADDEPERLAAPPGDDAQRKPEDGKHEHGQRKRQSTIELNDGLSAVEVAARRGLGENLAIELE